MRSFLAFLLVAAAWASVGARGPNGGARAQWVEPPGTGWLQVEAAHHRTDTRFDETGTIDPLFTAESRSVTTSLFLKGAVGLVRGVDVWAELPFHRLRFTDVSGTRASTGPGDLRFFLRAGPSLLGISSLPLAVAVRGGVKLPVGDFPVDAEISPLTEGQRDWELLLEVGRSLHPWPVYVAGWAGYRWREINSSIARKPGDERFFYLAAGGSLGRFQWKLAVDALFGRPPERRLSTGLRLPLRNDVRELVQVLPRLGIEAGPGVVEIGARVPVHGRNMPAGPALTVGYFVTWDAALWTSPF